MARLKIETPRDKLLSVRVTGEEHAKLERAGKALGLRGATGFMRFAALREAELLTASALELRVKKLEGK